MEAFHFFRGAKVAFLIIQRYFFLKNFRVLHEQFLVVALNQRVAFGQQ